jgi:hypothetical protein
MMQADADGQAQLGEDHVLGDAFLHVDRAEQTLHRPRKRAHDFVADRLDDVAAVAAGDFRQRIEHGGNEAARLDIAACLEQLGAAADVGEQDREGLALGHYG